MSMNMKMKPLPALIAVLMAGCGGGDGHAAGPQGETATTQIQASSLTTCVDTNQNWQCDDGDLAQNVNASGVTGLTPSADFYTLLETRDATNNRTGLLISEQGSGVVNGVSTLRTTLRLAGFSSTEIAAAESVTTNSQLEAGYAAVLKNYPVALSGLAAYSLALEDQANAAPTIPAFNSAASSTTELTHWQSDESAQTLRQLSARGSTVLNNSESNRLYVFDAEATALTTREIDLIPNGSPLVASVPKWLRPGFRALKSVLDVVVDTASAATGFNGTATTGSAVVLEPGKGIAGVQLLNRGREALVLMNMLNGSYTATHCLDSAHGTEGLFKVSIADANSFRLLDEAPACIHSGFSLIASDAAGAHIAAWDAKGKKLWVLDGATMQAVSVIELGLDSDKPPQALAMSPGGRYLAAVGYGRAALVDLINGKVITQFAGNWGNVAQASFAAGSRRLLVASEQQIHSIALDDRLQLIALTSATLAGAADSLRALSVSADGDSYVTVSDTTAYWNAAADNKSLAAVTLPVGVNVQQAVVSEQHLIVMARGLQDQQFKILRLALPLSSHLFAQAVD